jgi:hypothetical protein
MIHALIGELRVICIFAQTTIPFLNSNTRSFRSDFRPAKTLGPGWTGAGNVFAGSHRAQPRPSPGPCHVYFFFNFTTDFRSSSSSVRQYESPPCTVPFNSRKPAPSRQLRCAPCQRANSTCGTGLDQGRGDERNTPGTRGECPSHPIASCDRTSTTRPMGEKNAGIEGGGLANNNSSSRTPKIWDRW